MTNAINDFQLYDQSLILSWTVHSLFSFPICLKYNMMYDC